MIENNNKIESDSDEKSSLDIFLEKYRECYSLIRHCYHELRDFSNTRESFNNQSGYIERVKTNNLHLGTLLYVISRFDHITAIASRDDNAILTMTGNDCVINWQLVNHVGANSCLIDQTEECLEQIISFIKNIKKGD